MYKKIVHFLYIIICNSTLSGYFKCFLKYYYFKSTIIDSIIEQHSNINTENVGKEMKIIIKNIKNIKIL